MEITFYVLKLYLFVGMMTFLWELFHYFPKSLRTLICMVGLAGILWPLNWYGWLRSEKLQKIIRKCLN